MDRIDLFWADFTLVAGGMEFRVAASRLCYCLAKYTVRLSPQFFNADFKISLFFDGVIFTEILFLGYKEIIKEMVEYIERTGRLKDSLEDIHSGDHGYV